MTVTALASTAAGSPGGSPGGEHSEPPAGRRRGRVLLVALALLVALGGAGYWFVLRPAPAAAPAPGTVLPLDAIQVNLAGGHYLKVGIALQLVEGSKDVDGSKALDALIEEFSGRSIDQLAQPVQRQKLKAQLIEELAKRYHDDVMGVYFTEFVTQ